MVELYADEELLEMDANEGITYSLTVNDIFDLSTVNASYTNSFGVPKTPGNTRRMKMLGMVGDKSDIPYIQVPAKLKRNGFSLIEQGWLNMINTSDREYKIAIINGIIDFFKAIENRSIGSMDLTEITHTRNVATVAASFTNVNYRYIIADYNGEVTREVDGLTYLNIDYLIPSASVAYLWNKIFNTFGWTFSGTIFENEDFANSWITFAKGLETSEVQTVVLDTDDVSFPQINSYATMLKANSIDVDLLLYSIDNKYFAVAESGFYKVELTGTVESRPQLLSIPRNAKFYISKNADGISGIPPVTWVIANDVPSGDEINTGTDLIISLQEGDTVCVVATYAGNQRVGGLRIIDNDVSFTLTKFDQNNIDFASIFADYQIKDFFKEQVMRFGLTPITDVRRKHITFLTNDERFDKSGAINWTKKYVRRTNEKYIFGSYAQQNILKHKYGIEGDNYSDGQLLVNNQNLEDRKNLFESKTYSYDNSIRTIVPGIQTYLYPMWNKQPKTIQNDEEEDTVEIEYKPLTSRFYVMKSATKVQSVRLLSPTFSESLVVSSVAIAMSDMTTFKDLVPEYWQEYSRLLSDFRCHDIELSITETDIQQLDLGKLYYFEQENGFYILNKLSFKTQDTSTGEFVRVKG